MHAVVPIGVVALVLKVPKIGLVVIIADDGLNIGQPILILEIEHVHGLLPNFEAAPMLAINAGPVRVVAGEWILLVESEGASPALLFLVVGDLPGLNQQEPTEHLGGRSLLQEPQHHLEHIRK